MTLKSLLGAASAGAVLAALAVGPAAAAGFYVQEQSVRGLGRAYSGEAADTGSASLWWNPAAIGGGKGRGDFTLGIQHVAVDATIRDAGSTIQRTPAGLPALPVGGNGVQIKPIDKGDIPNFGVSYKLNDKFAVGLGLSAPFNFTTRYPLNSFTRYQALKSRLFNVDIQPTIAFTPVPQLTIGLGVDFNYADATLSNALPNLSPLLPDAGSNLTGRGWDTGWTAGLQWRPTDKVTLGASYRSGIKHNLDGQVTVAGLLGPAAAANTDVAATANFSTPSIITVSGRVKVTDKLTLQAQVQHFDWSVFDAIRVQFSGRTQVTAQNYEDTTSVAGGVEYQALPNWTLRAGVQHDPTPTPDIGRTTRVPDGDRWLYGAGATVMASPNISIDLSAAYIHFVDSAILSDATAFAGTALQMPVAMRGSVHGHGWVLAIGSRFSF